MTPVGVLSVVSEIFPLIKTGGLADVAGALPGALAAEAVTVRSLVPGYPRVLAALDSGVAVARMDALFGGEARIVAAKAAGLELFVLDAPHLMRAPAIPIEGRTAGTGRTTRSVSLPSHAWVRCWDRGSCRVIFPISCMRMTGRRVSRRPTCIMPAALGLRR